MDVAYSVTDFQQTPLDAVHPSFQPPLGARHIGGVHLLSCVRVSCHPSLIVALGCCPRLIRPALR